MRKFITFAAVLALAGCGGGGGGGSTAPTPSQPSHPNQSGYVTPQFVIVVPKRSSAKGRSPKYVSSAVQSVEITLTADSIGVNPSTISGNPAETDINGSSCSTGCVVNGPPTPPGTDSFTVVTYDATGGSGGSGHKINAGQLNNVSITAGQNNTESITLGAIPAALAIAATTTKTAGTQDQVQTLSVTATDAHGDTIPTGQTPAVLFVDSTGAALNVTVSDPDASAYGTCVSTDGSASCTSLAATQATMSGPDSPVDLRYDGLAENPVTLTASATGATNGTAAFQPTLNAPAQNTGAATPAGVALTSSPEIDLFVTSGTGSTGTQSFTESGWTNGPYGHALTYVIPGSACTSGAGLATAFSQIATLSAGTNDTTNGTPFTATAVGSPTAGSCNATITDGLTSNTTDKSATLTVTYTTGSVNASGKHRTH